MFKLAVLLAFVAVAAAAPQFLISQPLLAKVAGDAPADTVHAAHVAAIAPLAYAAPAYYAPAPYAFASGYRVAYSAEPIEQHGYKIAY